MKEPTFRKLDMELPLQHTYDQRPWFIGGVLFAVVFLLIVAYAYLQHKG